MKPRVYIETTIPSYLTARGTNDLFRTACQQVTRDWWDIRDRFDLFVSPAVLNECRGGDPTAGAARIEALRDLVELEVTVEAVSLARDLIARLQLPPRAEVDALHVAISAVHAMDFLLTWNCTHMANGALFKRIDAVRGVRSNSSLHLHSAAAFPSGGREWMISFGRFAPSAKPTPTDSTTTWTRSTETWSSSKSNLAARAESS